MIRHALRAFLSDPVGAATQMRGAVPAFPVAAMALMAATLVFTVIDYFYGSIAFPQTLGEGGKRADGPLVFAAIAVTRAFGTAAAAWVGLDRLMSRPVTGAEAMWMVLPYQLGLVLLSLVSAGTLVFFTLTGADLYGSFFTIFFVAALLLLVLGLKTLLPGSDWLRVLPVAMGVWFIGHFLPFVALAGAAVMSLRRSRYGRH